MNVKIILLIVFALIALFCNSAQSKCPPKKTNRKRQLQRIKTMDESVVVVEGKYLGRQENAYTFEIETVWDKQNGDLDRQTVIAVTPPSGSSISECFDELSGKKNYFLMVTPREETNAFTAIEPPVKSERKRGKLLQSIWEKLCAKLEGEENKCKTRVTLSPTENIYRGSMHIIECKVESSTPIRNITWDIDGTTLGSEIIEKAGISLKVEGTVGYVIINPANSKHNGRYSCTATSEDGQTATGHTELKVVGPRKSSQVQCPVDAYCVNGGLCFQELDGTNRYCECPAAFTGHRCQDIYIDVRESGSGNADLKNKMSQLTLAIVLVAVAFAGVLFFGSIYIFQLRNKASQNKDQYVAVEQCNTTYDTTTERRETLSTNAGIEATSSRLSAVVVSDVTNSRHTSTLAVNATPNGARREHLTTPRVSITSSHYENDLKAPSPHSISRPNSISSERSFRRERLNAKSIS